MSPRLRVLLSRPLPGGVERLLAEYFDVEVLEEGRAADPALWREALRGRHGVLLTVSERLDVGALEAATDLRVAANMAVGFDNIDVAEAAGRGVVVTNTPGVLTQTTAEFAVALILATLRRLGEADRFVRSGAWGTWQPLLLAGRDLHGSTVGIVGAGRIGSAVARIVSQGFGCRVLYWGRSANEGLERELGARRVSRQELLRESHVVSLHLPLAAETRSWIDAGALGEMRRDAILVNTSRGAIVDEKALVAALQSGRIGGAGLDVFEGEPSVPAELLELETVVLAPHIGSATVETRSRMARMAAENLRSVLLGAGPLHPVSVR